MSRIKILPEILANKIAAGEVVERPSSVVKELIENSIDAKSRRITIEIEKGGRNLIRVSDDGTGMKKDDALLAIERYATSKIKNDSDLFSISTLGFRGEALPSIASVSRFSIITCELSSDIGTKINIEGGQIKSVQEIGAPKGTMINVKQLFYNIPARRKFLKTINTEMGHIADIVSSIALGHPDIYFQLIHNSKIIKRWAGNAKPEKRVADVLGKELGKELFDCKTLVEEVAIDAWISSPLVNRSTSQKIYIYVNGRFVKNRGIVQALLDGYKGRLMKGRFPIAVLFINIAPEEVDVNVHPAKSEVRFVDQKKIHDIIKNLILQTLLKSDRPVSNVIQKKNKEISQENFSFTKKKYSLDKKTTFTNSDFQDNKLSTTIIEKPDLCSELIPTAYDDKYKTCRQGDPFVDKEKMPCIQQLNYETESSLKSDTILPVKKVLPLDLKNNLYSGNELGSRNGLNLESELGLENELGLKNKLGLEDELSSRDDLKSKNELGLENDLRSKNKLDLENDLELFPKEKFFKKLYIIGQLHNTYIICQSHSGMILIDQHAAHERIVFEQLKKKTDKRKHPSQKLLIPETIDLDYREAAVLSEMINELEKFGFEIEPFGGNTFAVGAVPVILSDKEVCPIILEIIEKMIQTGYNSNVQNSIDECLILISCHGAIRAGQSLSIQQMQELLQNLDQCENPSYCPHGRPTWIEWNTTSLEKSFRRTV